MSASVFHSVTLDKDKCKGCVSCVKRCPTEAIRVRNGKATIIEERCIDCGECIRVCTHHAKQPITDKLDVLGNFKYTIALPAPSLYGQFNNLDDINIILKGLLKLGFDDVFEVSKAAELVSDATRIMLKEGKLQKPIISSACPAVVRLIQIRFPSLIDLIMPLNSPAEMSARLAKEYISREKNIPVSDIGAIFISPCPAKNTASKMPLGTDTSYIDAVIGISEVYPHLVELMEDADRDCDLSDSGLMGIGWARSGGESAALIKENYLAADGIDNVIKVLEDLEDEKFHDLDFIELNACNGGCVGGVLTVENPYVAMARIKKLQKYLPVSQNHIGTAIADDYLFNTDLDYIPIFRLDKDFSKAMEKMQQVEEITESLAGIDCGACGAPSCKALAEDIVLGFADVGDCVFNHIKDSEDSFIPVPFRDKK